MTETNACMDPLDNDGQSNVQLNGDSTAMNGLNDDANVDSIGESVDISVGTTTKRQPPSYDDIFPALPGGLGGGPSSSSSAMSMASSSPMMNHSATAIGVTSLRPKIRSSTVSIVYRVTPEELRYRDQNRRGEDLSRICADIMLKTGTDITLTQSKDGTLTFLISGKQDATLQAKKMLANEFQAQTVLNIPIPKEHHRLILGKAGKKLNDLEQVTQTKIQIPKQDEKSDVIRITGTREAIEKAAHEIQLISNEAFSRFVERIDVPKIYHPFIFGPFGQTLEQIQKETGAKVNVPPPSVHKEEITITGERNNVKAALERVKAIFDEKSRRCQTVSIEVKKPRHKYVVGPKGNTLNEIMQLTGVSVEMPPSDSPTEIIILRGEPDKLANALSVVLQRACSDTDEEIEVPAWIHRHILGPKGAKFQELSQEFPKVNVSFETEANRIKLSGLVADVQKASELLKNRANEIASKLTTEEIKVPDPKHIKFIVGKNGANLKQIREDTKATIQVYTNDQPSNDSKNSNNHYSPQANGNGPFIYIEGTPESVAKAKQELQTLLDKLENEITQELSIERRFYGQLIGSKGEKIRDIRNKFNQVMIIFPEQNDQSEKVIIRGAKQDVEQCYKYLLKLNQELLANNCRLEVPILKQLLHFQGKDSIKKIREETGARLEVQNDADSIVITGPKDKVEKAHERIQAMQNSLSDMSQVDIIVPSRIHNYMLGTKGRNVRSIQNECGGVIITFPTEGSGSDRVTIRGPKDSVQKAKQKLVEMSNDYQTNNYNEELKVKVEHHRYLIGKNGSKINKLREQANVRVQFASDAGSSSKDDDRVIITGKKEDVQKARQILESQIKELDKVTELEMRVDPKYHHLFVARRAAVCKQLYDEYGGVNVSFPPQSDKTNDRITLKGPKECLDAVKQRILEIVADFDAQETIDVEIDAQHHRQLLAPRSNRINALQQEYDVKIKFPARPNKQSEQQNNQENQDNNGSHMIGDNSRANIVTITGRKENCEKAKEELLALVPVSIEVSIPYEFHRFIIGQKGAEVRDLMDKHNVHIHVPPTEKKSDIIIVTGTGNNVENCRKALEEKLVQLEKEKADREARSYQLTLQVDPIYHPKIIGKRGAVITSIRRKFDVQIQVPESNRANPQQQQQNQNQSQQPQQQPPPPPPANNDIITIIGYEDDAHKAKEYILKLVQDLKDLTTEEVEVDNRIHSRLIGTRGKNIKRLMDQFKVDIKFPKVQNGENPDIVTITGAKENVEECKEHIQEMADSFLDDIEVQYQPPNDRQFQINFEDLSSSGAVKESNKGFVVRGGPWEKRQSSRGGNHGGGIEIGIDTTSAQDFPAFVGPNDSILQKQQHHHHHQQQQSLDTSSESDNLPINGSLLNDNTVPASSGAATERVIWGPKRN